MKIDFFNGATGCLVRHVPEGPELDALLGLVRIGVKFAKQQHKGRRPGFLHRYLSGIVAQMTGPVTFERLVAQLQIEAARRGASDGKGLPIEACSRSFEILTYHNPAKGRVQIAFGTLRNIFTKIKKDQFTGSAKE